MLEVLFEDNHCLAVNKPAGLLAQGDVTGEPSLLEAARDYLKEKYAKPGNVFVGLVHRLDRPTSGVVVPKYNVKIDNNNVLNHGFDDRDRTGLFSADGPFAGAGRKGIIFRRSADRHIGGTDGSAGLGAELCLSCRCRQRV